MLDTQTKSELIKKHAIREGDTGSAEVQVAIMTHRIVELTRHMTAFPHDFHSKRALLRLVGQRRRMLSYLEKEDINRYKNLIKALGLRK
ncbi:MAG: 30S ribosomal protein S15 [Dehalococcoidia bacterium]|nr:30S ribosomal protein S15 [Dehalococcoidia bacterium]